MSQDFAEIFNVNVGGKCVAKGTRRDKCRRDWMETVSNAGVVIVT